jgi:hypothetical protein
LFHYSYTQKLGEEMFEARISGDSNNEELVLDQSDWMQLSDMRPDVESEIEFSLLKETSNFDWKTTRDKYNESELERGIGWLSKEKEKHKQIIIQQFTLIMIMKLFCHPL